MEKKMTTMAILPMLLEAMPSTLYLAKESSYSRKAWHNKPSGVAKAKRAKQKRKNKS